MYQGYQLLIKLIHYKFDTDNWGNVICLPNIYYLCNMIGNMTSMTFVQFMSDILVFSLLGKFFLQL